MKLSIKDIKPNPDNPRLIKDDKYQKLVQSLKDFPEMAEVREIVVNKDHIILGGNMRFKAMQEAGWGEIPVKVVDWTPEKQAEFVIKDNASFGEWEWDVLANQYELEDLEAWGVDLPEYLTADEEVEEDEAPELDDKEPPKSKLGEIYQLGRHRVMCGDSTDKANLGLLMDGNKADMVYTDPPYNFESKGAGFLQKSTANMRERVKDIVDFNPADIAYLVDEPVNTFLFFCNKALVPTYIDIFRELDFNILVWHKTNPTPFTSNNFLPDIEYLLLFTRKGRVWNNSLKPTSIYSKVYSSTKLEGRKDTVDSHPTIKPQQLLTDKIRVCSNENGIVLDLFLGSGSTLIACEQTDRTCYGMELDPKYVDVIRKRYAKFIQPDNQLPDNWEELTPKVSEESVKNG